MNQLTLHYVNLADRERAITDDLYVRQILDKDGQANATTNATTNAATNAATPHHAATPGNPGNRSTQPRRQTPIRARAAGR